MLRAELFSGSVVAEYMFTIVAMREARVPLSPVSLKLAKSGTGRLCGPPWRDCCKPYPIPIARRIDDCDIGGLVARGRPSQPVNRVLSPGLAISMNLMASKCERVPLFEPQA